MQEFIALVHLSINRYRRLLLSMISLILLGLCSTLIGIQWFGVEFASTIGGYAIFFSLLPSGVAAIALFDYGLDQDLSQSETGCSHWLLRQPIHSWKIALVPVALKMTWVSTIWMTFALIMRTHGLPEIPILQPCISFSAVLVWIMVFSWRPFPKSLYRLLAILIALPLCYCMIAAGFAAPSLNNPTWAPIAIAASWLVTLVFFCSGVWCLLRATDLARLTPSGGYRSTTNQTVDEKQLFIKSATTVKESGFLFPDDGSQGNHLRTILWHDYISLRDWLKKVYLVGVIPGALLYGLITSLHVVSVIGLFFGLIYLVVIINSKHLIHDHVINGKSKTPSHLPSYLATKPIPSKTIAWGRQILPISIAISTYAWVLIVIGLWSLRSSNRTAWMQWSSLMAQRLGQPEESFEIGLKLSTSIVLGIGILFLTRIMAHAWVAASGRTWVVATNSTSSIACIFVPLIAFLAWFLQQTDWETTEQSARGMLRYLPNIAISLLTIKGALTIVIATLSIRERLITYRDLALTMTTWVTLVLMLAFLFRYLIPHDTITLLNCCIAMTLMIPIARWLALPIAISWNRHR